VSNAALVASWFTRDGAAWDQAVVDWFAATVWHPQIDWRAIEGGPDDVGLIQGPDRLRRYYGEWLELFDDIRHEVFEQYDVGDRAVLAMCMRARARSTDMPLELDYAMAVELEDVSPRATHEDIGCAPWRESSNSPALR
jgi:ketosteroid isomerase-like protein